MVEKIKVLVVDDSALVREILTKGLSQDPSIEVVGAVEDPYEARDKILSLRPHVLTLDIEMPRMNGLEFLEKLMSQYPMPVVMVSSLTQRGAEATIQALSLGAVDFVPKPSGSGAAGLSSLMGNLITKVKLASQVDLSSMLKRRRGFREKELSAKGLSTCSYEVIAMGCSTGGPEALIQVFSRLPEGLPGIVLVQHMPPVFTKILAKRLDEVSSISVSEAVNGDAIKPGTALVAPGGKHMKLVRVGSDLRVKVFEGERVNGHCPSVDVLFHSVAEFGKNGAIGVILTGMGADGAEGLRSMRDNGARTISQDKDSCVVFGMPKAAEECGAVEDICSLEEIPGNLIKTLNKC